MHRASPDLLSWLTTIDARSMTTQNGVTDETTRHRAKLDTLDSWVREATESTALTERQAEALYRLQEGETGSEAAEEMGTSASNVYNLEQAASRKITDATNLLDLASQIDATPEGSDTQN